MRNQMLRDTLKSIEEGSHSEMCAQRSLLRADLQEPWDELTLSVINVCIALLEDEMDIPLQPE